MKEAKIDVGEIAINSIPDVPIWDSKPVTVDFTLSEFDKSSTSTIFKSRFNEFRQKYSDFCHIYTDGSKVERKVASAYVCPYGTRSYRRRDGCSIFTAEVEAIDKALKYVKVSSVECFVMFSDSMSVLEAIENQESKNPLVNRVLQTCQEILSNGKFITFCWIPSHRDITGNEDADRAAKDALSKAQPAHFELPCTDVFIKIQPFVSSLWQKRWDKEVGNKLHANMPQIDEKYYSGCTNRKDDVISHNACLNIDSLSFDDVIILLTVFEMLCFVFLSVLQGCLYSAFLLYNLDFILLRNIVLMSFVLHVLSLSIV